MKKGSISWKAVCFLVLVVFTGTLFVSDVLKIKETQASILNLPAPTEMVHISKEQSLPMLKGIRLDPSNSLQLEFIIDYADSSSVEPEEVSKLISYFLAGLTVPEEEGNITKSHA